MKDKKKCLLNVAELNNVTGGTEAMYYRTGYQDHPGVDPDGIGYCKYCNTFTRQTRRCLDFGWDNAGDMRFCEIWQCASCNNDNYWVREGPNTGSLI